ILYGFRDPRHFFFSSRRRHTRFSRDWSSDVCSSDLRAKVQALVDEHTRRTTDAMAAEDADLTRKLAAEGMVITEPSAAELAEARSEERRVGKEGRSRWSPYESRDEK